MRYKINSPETIHENLNDEVVVVNLQRGNYYSLNNIATDIWTLILHSYNSDEITNKLMERYPQAQNELQQSIPTFITNLQEEALIVADAEKMSADEVALSADTKLDNFTTPVLEKYTDMQDLLMLDPIHEVDETGWPNTNLNVLSEDKHASDK